VSQSAAQAGLNRTDRRTIAGLRWEHRFDDATTWRNQFVFDDRNIRQPAGVTGGKGDFPSYNVMTDVTQHGSLFGLKATHFLGAAYNTMSWSSDTFNLLPNAGPDDAVFGKLRANTTGKTANLEARAREEIELTDRVTGLAGVGVGKTWMSGTSTSYTYGASGALTRTGVVTAENSFVNVAPEVGLLYRPTNTWQLHGRVATAYGTPQLGNLFVTPTGDPGNNTQLKPQTLVGYELGADWMPAQTVRLSATGYYEFFRNELVSQTPGVGKSSYTFNAPASEHRGVELAADWSFAPGWRLFGAYTYNDHVFTEYTEQLATGTAAGRFDRNGKKIPGVSPNELTARLGYDQPAGPLAGLGGFVEFVWKSAFHLDNANILKVPGYELTNLNLHYTTALQGAYVRELSGFFEVRNLFDRRYIASANNVTNTLGTGGAQNGAAVLANATGSIYAGAPRTFVVGMRLKL
jgi:iron complex outermembrane receptor protein